MPGAGAPGFANGVLTNYFRAFHVRLPARIAVIARFDAPVFAFYSGYPAATLRSFGRPMSCSSSAS